MKLTLSQNAKNAIKLGTLCSISYFAVYIARNVLSPVTNQMLNEGFNEAYFGLISSVFLLSYACGQLINGFIGHKIPAKFMLFIGLLGAGCTYIIFPFIAHNKIGSMFTYGITGFFLSMIYSPMVKLVAENTEPIHAVRCSLGYTFASLLGSPTASLLAAFLTWQSVFLTSSGALICMAIIALIFFVRFEKKGVIKPKSQTHVVRTEKSGFKMLVKRGIIKFSFISILTGIIRTSVVFWIPTYLAQQLNFSASSAAKINTAVMLAISSSSFIAIFMYERLKRNINASMLISFITSSIFFALTLVVKVPVANIIFLTLAILSGECSSSLMWSVYCPSLRDTGMTSIATGYLDFLSYSAAALSSIIFGNAVTHIGWNPLIAIWLALMIIGIIVSLPYKYIFKRQNKNNTTIETTTEN